MSATRVHQLTAIATIAALSLVAQPGPAAAQGAPPAGDATPDAGVPPGPDSATAPSASPGPADPAESDSEPDANNKPAVEPTDGRTTEPGLPETEAPPPETFQSFDVDGQLLESKATVRGFLAPRMARTRVLNSTTESDLREFCNKQLGYQLIEIRRDRLPGGAIRAVLVLAPLVVVYQVKVNIDNLPNGWWYPWNIAWLPQLVRTGRAFFDSVFADQVRRRMRLRQGAPLPAATSDRAKVLNGERIRIQEFLRNEGYFDARVEVSAAQRDARSMEIVVQIKKGDRYVVGQIRVEGATAIAPQEIESRFRHSWVCFIVCVLDGGFSREQLTRDVQSLLALYHNRGYPGARIRTDFDVRTSFRRETKSVTFTIIINEKRKIDVVFVGNNKTRFSDERLQREVTFAAEGSYDPLEITASAEAIRRFYQVRGHFEASVLWERLQFGSVFERIIFSIEEGPKLPVRSVSFEGNHALSNDDIRGLVKTKRFRDVAFLGGGGGFVTTVQLQQDVDRIAEAYRDRGFAQVKIRARVARARAVQGNAAALAAAVAGAVKASGLYVRFIVDEGPQNVITSLTIEFPERAKRLALLGSDPSARAALARYYAQREREIARLVTLRSGTSLNPTRPAKDKKRLKRFYFERGYPHADIQIKTPIQEIETSSQTAATSPDGSAGTTRSVPVTISVTERAPTRFGKLAIRGSFHTSHWIIRDELGFEEGDLLTLTKVERAQQNLRRSGLFKSVNVAFVDFDDETQDSLNVVAKVQERPRYELEVGAGYSTDNGQFTDSTFKHNNWLGLGLRPDLRLHYGRDLKFGEAKLLLPRWIGRRLSLGLIAFNTEATVFARRETTKRFGDLDTVGTSVALSKAGTYGFFRGWVALLRYDLRLRFRDVELVRPAGPSDDLTRGPVPTITGSIGPQLIVDGRTDKSGHPNPLLPERGYKLEVHASIADPALSRPVELFRRGGRDRFIKLGGSAQAFHKPSTRTLLSAAVRYDHGIPLGNEFVLPEVERFFAGGDTTVRGFEEDRLATEIIQDPLAPIGGLSTLRVLPAGGNIRFISNLEFQLDVWSFGPVPVSSAIFLDTGLVTNSLDGFEVRDLRHSIGASLLRVRFPIGAFSIEYAVPLTPKLGDNPRGRFHFNLGLLF